jgi:hypothetical protein
VAFEIRKKKQSERTIRPLGQVRLSDVYCIEVESEQRLVVRVRGKVVDVNIFPGR